uniref:B30.2/SPRY domain-containing protein n=1 Tax=Myripristis murdjan TaxID=586833 RepID=A0A667YKU0_9TELE
MLRCCICPSLLLCLHLILLLQLVSNFSSETTFCIHFSFYRKWIYVRFHVASFFPFITATNSYFTLIFMSKLLYYFAFSISGVPVSVHQGHTATLPCWLNPPKSAESLDVRWFLRDTFDAPLLSYQGRQVHHGSQYVDRAAFGLRDATSSGLKAGDVSLELVNVTLRDAGVYTCYVSSDQGYDKGTVQLNVISECCKICALVKYCSAPTFPVFILTLFSVPTVNVTLDNTENPFLRTKDGRIVRDGDVPDVPDGALVTGATSIKGASGFSSGRHYWEVLLGNEKVGFKKSWWIGVTSVTGSLEGLSGLPRASHGYWFLSSDATKGLWLNTEPVVLLPVQSTPQTLGVYLDYDSGKLSFYSAGDKRHIATVECSFKGEVFPFFNPGKGDAAPMEIVHREEVESSHDEHV